MKKILFLSKLIPFKLHDGGSIRNFQRIKFFSQHYDIYIIGFVKGDADFQSENTILYKYCKNIYIIRLPTFFETLYDVLFHFISKGKPFLISKYFSFYYLTAIKQLLTKHHFDFIFCSELATTQYIKTLNIGHPKVVFDNHNAEFLLIERYAQTKNFIFKLFLLGESKLIKRYELNVIGHLANKTIFVSNYDYEIFQGLLGKNINSTIIKNCFSDNGGFRDSYSNKNIFFVGNLSRGPNRDGIKYFIDFIFNKIKEFEWGKGLMLYVMGSNVPVDVRSYESEYITVIDSPDEDRKNEVLLRGGVGIAPLLSGSGTRIKIIEYYSYGLPVVSTLIGAEGLVSSSGTLLFTDEKTGIDCIKKIVLDYEYFKKLGISNYLTFQSEYDEKKVFKSSIYSSITT